MSWRRRRDTDTWVRCIHIANKEVCHANWRRLDVQAVFTLIDADRHDTELKNTNCRIPKTIEIIG